MYMSAGEISMTTPINSFQDILDAWSATPRSGTPCAGTSSPTNCCRYRCDSKESRRISEPSRKARHGWRKARHDLSRR